MRMHDIAWRNVVVAAAVVLAMFVAANVLSVGGPAEAAAPYRAGAAGDADCSSLVTADDARHVLRQLAGILPVDPQCGSDANDDLAVTMADALVVRKWVAGLPVRPVLEAVLPRSVPLNSPPVTFTLHGGLIAPGTVVLWNGTPYAITIGDGGSSATVTIPASEFDTEGGYFVALSTPGEGNSVFQEFGVTAAGTCSAPVATGGQMVVDKVGDEDNVETVSFTLNAPQVMTGWTLLSTSGPQVYEFPDGYIYNPANGVVTIYSNTDAFADTATKLFWRAAPTWNNTEHDSAQLLDCTKHVVVEWIDPEPPDPE